MGPAGPSGPVAPVGPSGPWGPVGPCGPCCPVETRIEVALEIRITNMSPKTSRSILAVVPVFSMIFTGDIVVFNLLIISFISFFLRMGCLSRRGIFSFFFGRCAGAGSLLFCFYLW